MDLKRFRVSLDKSAPPDGLGPAVEALWWDAKGDWAKAHGLVNDLETPEAMAVHAYLHRKEGDLGNSEYWYRRAGRKFWREKFEAEWEALVTGLTAGEGGSKER